MTDETTGQATESEAPAAEVAEASGKRPKVNKQKLTEAELDGVTTLTAKALEGYPKRTIKIYQAPPSEKQLPDVQVGLNGYIYSIKRGVDVEVPEPIYDILAESGYV